MSGSEARPLAGDGTLDLIVSGIRAAGRDVKLFELSRADSGPLPAVEPGAHIDLSLSADLVRQYSLLRPGAAPRAYVIGVKREAEGRGGSRALHDDIGVGTALKASAPRNHFALHDTPGHTVLIAGGIGVTPLWCMAQGLAAAGRPWSLYYACRSRQDAILLEEMAAHGDRVNLSFSDETSRQRFDLAAIVAEAPPGSHFYCCGPQRMLEGFAAATASLPEAQAHLEYFSSKVDQALDGGFLVELAKSGLTVTVPKGKSILEVVLQAGADVVHSCTSGYCGTCETRVLAGQPDHRDVYLTKAEKAAGATMMICCSGSLSPKLVLDL